MGAIQYRLKQLREILEPGQRRALVLLAALSAFSALLEAFAVNLVPVFVLILQDAQSAARLPLLRDLLAADWAPRGDALIVAGGVVLLVVFLAKNLFGVALLELQSQSLRRVQSGVAARMLRGYLCAPYRMHMERNSNQLVRSVLSDLGTMTGSILQPCLMLAAEVPVALLLGAILFYASPAAAAAALLLGGLSSWMFYRSVRTHVIELGRVNQQQGRYALQYMVEALGGIRETKLYGAEAFSCQRAIERFDLSSRAQYRLTMLNLLPRYFNETVAILGILLFTFVTLALAEGAALLPLLALFAVSMVRLVPSMNRIVGAFTSLRFGLAPLDTVHRDLNEFGKLPAREARVAAPAADAFERLEARGLRFAYPDAAGFRLEVDRFELRRGERVALAGASGSGKSTLVDLLAGLLPPDAGQVLCNGVPVARDVMAWQRRIGYVSQQIHLLDDSILRNVAFAVPDAEIDLARVREALEAAQLAEFVAGLPQGIGTGVGELGARLSGGQRQRLGIARALYRRPEILVLDEGTSALDAETEAQVAQTLRLLAARMAVLVIAHRLSSVRDFDRIEFMENGRIVASGSFEALAAQAPGFARMLDLAGVARA